MPQQTEQRQRRRRGRRFFQLLRRQTGTLPCEGIALGIEKGIQHGTLVAAERHFSSQLTAFFTSASIRASSAAVNSFRAKSVGHMAPSSRFALSLKPNVAYRVLNFSAGRK